ncbi:uncharacterized protein LOC143264950 [Megachile rotundata]|uniref:uncharacterized protein LOC143264950 n=1 Tax=Megachile rotundata TaxID=143995 RepID=UPI003FD41C09
MGTGKEDAIMAEGAPSPNNSGNNTKHSTKGTKQKYDFNELKRRTLRSSGSFQERKSSNFGQYTYKKVQLTSCQARGPSLCKNQNKKSITKKTKAQHLIYKCYQHSCQHHDAGVLEMKARGKGAAKLKFLNKDLVNAFIQEMDNKKWGMLALQLKLLWRNL